ncbi:MAG: zinc ABC transporter substrate-binding protein [Bacteroidales bacterium]
MKMPKKFNRILIFAILLLVACKNDNKEAAVADQKKIVNVSVLPLKYFIEEMAGEFVEVNVMVPAGASPATYEPSPRKVQKLKKSDAYLRIEPLSFEQAWMSRFQANNKAMKLYYLARNIELLEQDDHKHESDEDHHCQGEDAELADPHIWVSPSTVLPMIKNIERALVDLYPGQEAEIEKNYQKLKLQVEKKDQFVRAEVAQMENKSFVIFHPALGYLARDYGLNQMVIENQGKEPSSRQMHKIIEKARKHDVSSVLAQKHFDMRNAKTIAKELGVKVNVINPLEENWPVMIDQIIESLTDKE